MKNKSVWFFGEREYLIREWGPVCGVTRARVSIAGAVLYPFFSNETSLLEQISTRWERFTRGNSFLFINQSLHHIVPLFRLIFFKHTADIAINCVSTFDNLNFLKRTATAQSRTEHSHPWVLSQVKVYDLKLRSAYFSCEVRVKPTDLNVAGSLLKKNVAILHKVGDNRPVNVP